MKCLQVFNNDLVGPCGTVTDNALSKVVVTVAAALFRVRSSVPRDMLVLGEKVKFKVMGETFIPLNTSKETLSDL